MAEPVVWNQLGPVFGDMIRAAVPQVDVVDIPVEPVEAPSPAGQILYAMPRHEVPQEQLTTRAVPWAAGLEWVHTASAGVDVYPPSLFEGRTVTCSRGVMSVPIAEFVLATMLAADKRLPEMWAPDGPRGDPKLGTLQGATLGLVGLGTIAEAVAERASVFGMEILAARRTERPSPIPGLTVAPLQEVVARADHLVVLAPATPETWHLIDDAVLAAVKPGVHLVNVARGTLVDQDALLRALDDGRVRLASLDVTDPEPLPADHPLLSHPRVRISPHVSWSAPGMLGRSVERFVENLQRYLAGDPLLGLVDPGAGY
jgi:phosphoglycerate dehydrogenase-like enzyme